MKLISTRKLANQSVFYSFCHGIEALVPFLLAPLLTRMLVPDAYATWVLFVTYASVLRPLVGMTIQDAIRMHYLELDQDQLEKLLQVALLIMFGMMLITASIMFVFQGPISGIASFPSEWLVSLAVMALLYEFFYIMLALHQFAGSLREYLQTHVIQATASMIFVVIFLLAGLDWQGVVLGRMLGLFIGACFSFSRLKFSAGFMMGKPDWNFLPRVIRFGFFYVPAGMVFLAVGLTDKMVVAYSIDLSSSGMYGAAGLFASAFWLVNMGVLLAWSPWLFRHLQSNTDEDWVQIRRISVLFYVSMAAVMCIVLLLADLIAPIVLGKDFHVAIEYIPFMMFLVLFQGYFAHNLKFLHQAKRIKAMSCLCIFTMLLNLFFSLLWVENMGMQGVLYASILSYGVATLTSGVVVLVYAGSDRRSRKTVPGDVR